MASQGRFGLDPRNGRAFCRHARDGRRGRAALVARLRAIAARLEGLPLDAAAEALDFSTRRDPIDLPRFAAPPPRACWPRWMDQEMPVSRRGWVTQVVEAPPGGRIRRARIVKVDVKGENPGHPYSKRTRKRFNDDGQLVLRMRLNENARKDVANFGRVFAQLETTVVGRDGVRKKEAQWAILVPSRRRR